MCRSLQGPGTQPVVEVTPASRQKPGFSTRGSAVPPCLVPLKTVVDFGYSQLGESRNQRGEIQLSKEASFASVSVTHWPKPHHTLTRRRAAGRETAWDRKNWANKRPMGRVRPAGSGVPGSSPGYPGSCSPFLRVLQQEEGGHLAPKDSSPPKDARASH